MKILFKIDIQKEIKLIINELEAQEILIPVKNSGYSFQNPKTYNKYKIKDKDNKEIFDELDKIINLDVSYYKRHPDEFIADKNEIFLIEQYFKTRKSDDIELSINERSLEIFGDEKKLSSNRIGNILKKIRLNISDFNTYESREPFMYYKNHQTNSKNVLIVENKDTWNTIKRAIVDGFLIFGLNFEAVIYGEGEKILSSFNFIKDKEYQEFNSKENIFYYFGDIDSTGINILNNLINKYLDYKIVPFYSAYNFLLKNGVAHKKVKEDNTEKIDIKIKKEVIEKYFSEYDVDFIFNICVNSEIIPQETLNNRVLRREKK